MNKNFFHDAKPGPLKRCQISDKDDLELVLDLGHQPLCDSLLNEDQLNMPEKTYPLRLYRSKSLGHGQLDYVVPGEEVYFPDYPYRPGITKEVINHHSKRAAQAIKKYNITQGSLIIDIGSNDGTLLNEYKKRKMRVLGIEPTNTGNFAREKDIDTIQKFFTEDVGRQISSEYGKAKLVTATNVFAHMSTMGEVIRGVLNILDNEGVFIFENHYIVDILKGNQFDTIYHEHIRSYSLTSIIYLFEMYDMKVINAEIVGRYGGTIRVEVSANKSAKVSQSIDKLILYEKRFGLFESKTWRDFKDRVIKSKNDLMEIAINVSNKGQRFVGKSCPGRCSTLLNYIGIGKDLMPYIAEQPTSLKLGMYLPGKHIPIVNDELLYKEQPDYVVILAWHYWKPITKILRSNGLKSKIVIPLPEVRIIK